MMTVLHYVVENIFSIRGNVFHEGVEFLFKEKDGA